MIFLNRKLPPSVDGQFTPDDKMVQLEGFLAPGQEVDGQGFLPSSLVPVTRLVQTHRDAKQEQKQTRRRRRRRKGPDSCGVTIP